GAKVNMEHDVTNIDTEGKKITAKDLKTEEEMRLLHAKIDRLLKKDNPDLLALQKLQTTMLGEVQQQLIAINQQQKADRQ
ncbi:MAG: hypothetical protein ACTICO_04810, partial [Leuconostoc citreum]